VAEQNRRYSALVSSDWNECLAPCGPFDPIFFAYPELEPLLTGIFRQYTSNGISLGEACLRIRGALPAPITKDQMDAYLETSFLTYRGVARLMEWCSERGILFMINTTGMQGYFQRALRKDLLPRGIVVAANPLIHFPDEEEETQHIFDVLEIQDKASNTERVMREYGIPPERVILIGDSGGDGPHFEWGRSAGAFLIGSMTKPSLEAYCESRGITLDARFGLCYPRATPRDPAREMQVDFTMLIPVMERLLFVRQGQWPLGSLHPASASR